LVAPTVVSGRAGEDFVQPPTRGGGVELAVLDLEVRERVPLEVMLLGS